MNLDAILNELQAERDRIDQAISALSGIKGTQRLSTEATKPNARRGRQRRGRMSAAARKKMSEQMKKRWAERKKAEARAR